MHKKIYLLRHGETEWSRAGKHTGRTDIPLTSHGRKEAHLLGASLKGLSFNRIFCSPLKRAQETCDLCGIDPEQKNIDRRLLEWNYGDYEGLTSQEIHKINPGWTIFSADPPHGESSSDIQKRVDSLLSDLLLLKGNIALFSSGHIMRALGARWLGQPVSFGRSLTLSTGSKSILGFEHSTPAILLWNDTSHLI